MTRPAEPQRIDLSFEELEAILDKAVRVPLTEEERDKLRSVVESLALLTEELAAERTSLARLRKFLFGAKKSEKTRDVCGEEQGADESSPGSGGAASNNSEKDPGDTDASADAGRGPAKKGPRGHGRNGANAYAGAEEIAVPHGELKVGDPCPECPEREGKNKGRLYALPPSRVVRVFGRGPFHALVIKGERLRCSLCGAVFAAELPGWVGEKKYDETARAMIPKPKSPKPHTKPPWVFAQTVKSKKKNKKWRATLRRGHCIGHDGAWPSK